VRVGQLVLFSSQWAKTRDKSASSSNFTLQYGNGKLQKNQGRLKLNDLHQVFAMVLIC
jgi:hypothetical protein